MRKKEELEKVCRWCEKKFLCPPYRRGFFCSRECSAKGRSMRNTVFFEGDCKSCGKHFKRPKYNTDETTKYCSIQCMAKERGKKMSGSNHPFWKGGCNRTGSSTICNKIKADVGKCERCESPDNLHAHHKISVNKRPDLAKVPENIEILCAICHAQEHPEYKGMLLKKKSGTYNSCKQCNELFYVPKYRKNQQFCKRICYLKEVRNEKAKIQQQTRREPINERW